MSWDMPALAMPDGTLAGSALAATQADSRNGYWFDNRAGPVSQPSTGPSAAALQEFGPQGHAPPGYALVPWGNGFASVPVAVRSAPSYAIADGGAPSQRGWNLADHGFGAAGTYVEYGRDFGYAPPLPPLSAYMAQPYAGGAAALASPLPIAPPPKPRRWSADTWAMLRKDGAGPLPNGLMPSTYGASQAGAVLRYRLSLKSRMRPTVYLRTTSSMGMMRETAAAFGVSARPIPSIPVIAAVEGRMVDQAGNRRIQAAAMAVTEFAPFRLPLGLRGEAYAQGGYVGGQYATPFIDGQLRVDRGLVSVGNIEARVGGGVWGGMQKGASRLDAGPGATVAFPLGRGTSGRVALDWRFRVAGDAAPGSGPAVTLSAGF